MECLRTDSTFEYTLAVLWKDVETSESRFTAADFAKLYTVQVNEPLQFPWELVGHTINHALNSQLSLAVNVNT